MWTDGLTKAEKKHLKDDAGCRTLEAFTRTAADQKAWRDSHPTEPDGPVCEPCWTCRGIAKKLGLPV